MHFWSAREVGLFDTPFGDYYVKFIAHFVSVYERTAPPFARESARWSSSEENIAKYLENDRKMSGLVGLTLEEAQLHLPEEERGYTGSNAQILMWPYGYWYHSTPSLFRNPAVQYTYNKMFLYIFIHVCCIVFTSIRILIFF